MAECERLLSAADLITNIGSLILLPIPTARDNKYISGTAFTIGEIASMLDSSTAVAGYEIPAEIMVRATERGATVYDAALDEDFLTKNAELTARGAVGYILTNSKKDLSDMSVGVVGYGRIGMRLVRWLLPFGCNLTVYTNRHEVALELCESGVSAEMVSEISDLTHLDLLINTAPARQIDDSILHENLTVIDLASGSVFKDSRGVIKLASIPNAFYPLTAGRVYAEGIMSALGGMGK
jgi:hypothetical protein